MKQTRTEIPATERLPEDFRIFLQSELMRRCQKNPKYSLRAFAAALGIAPSFLSHLLRARRPLTKATLLRLAQRIDLSPAKVKAFHAFHFEGAAPVAAGGPSQASMNQLTLDQFEVISDWYHYAILEAITLDHTEHSPRWLARALGITVPEVNGAIERLERLGLIALGPGGRWLPSNDGNTTAGNAFTATAFRKLQRQILTKAIDALEEIPMEQRDQSSLTIALDSALLPELKARLKAFQQDVRKLQTRSANRNQVYHLSFSAYPIVKPQKPKSQKSVPTLEEV